MILEPDRVVYPRAVVVHLQDARPVDPAVVRPVRLELAAPLAVPEFVVTFFLAHHVRDRGAVVSGHETPLVRVGNEARWRGDGEPVVSVRSFENYFLCSSIPSTKT